MMQSVLQINFSEPYRGRVGANGLVATWLLAHHRIWALPSIVSEMQLVEFIQQSEPHWRTLFQLAGIAIEPTPPR